MVYSSSVTFSLNLLLVLFPLLYQKHLVSYLFRHLIDVNHDRSSTIVALLPHSDLEKLVLKTV